MEDTHSQPQEARPNIARKRPLPSVRDPDQCHVTPTNQRAQLGGETILEQFETDFGEDLSRRQIESLPHLLKPGSLSEQARDAGIGRTTLYRWLEDDSFRSALQRLREQTMEIAESEVLAMTYEAAGVVYDTLRDEDKNLRFKAAQAILQQAHDTKYGHDLLRRFETLRDALKLRKDFDWRTRA